MQEAKKLYDALVDSGELKSSYKFMTGDWNRDKNSFLRQYRENEDLINSSFGNIFIDDDDDI